MAQTLCGCRSKVLYVKETILSNAQKYIKGGLKVAAGMAISMTALMGAGPALASDDYPDRAIHVQVGFSPGGATDIVVRTLAEEASKILDVPVVIDNKPGAGGVMPAQNMQHAKADGYTTGIVPLSVYRLPYTMKINWDPVDDLEYIIGITGYTWGLVVSGDSPINSFEEYVEYAKENPGEITYGTVGTLSTQHITMEKISKLLDIELTHVPYKGVSDAIPALLGGHIMSVADASSWVPYVESGDMKLLVVWTEDRLDSFPEVPTLQDVGIDMVQTSPWGLAAPKGTPKERVQILHDAFKQAMDSPKFLETLKQFNMDIQYMDSEQYRAFAKEAIETESAILEEMGAEKLQ